VSSIEVNPVAFAAGFCYALLGCWTTRFFSAKATSAARGMRRSLFTRTYGMDPSAINAKMPDLQIARKFAASGHGLTRPSAQSGVDWAVFGFSTRLRTERSGKVSGTHPARLASRGQNLESTHQRRAGSKIAMAASGHAVRFGSFSTDKLRSPLAFARPHLSCIPLLRGCASALFVFVCQGTRDRNPSAPFTAASCVAPGTRSSEDERLDIWKHVPVAGGKAPRPRRKKGEGTFIERANGTFAFIADLGRDPETGRRRRRWITANTKDELKRLLADAKARGGGTLKPRAVGTVGEWMTLWLAKMKTTLSPNAYVAYEIAWRLHAKPIVGDRALDGFDIPDVDGLYRRLQTLGKSPSIIERVGTIMHHAFVDAIKQRRYYHPNPFAVVDRPSIQRREIRALNPVEARRFLAAAAGDRYEALWVLLLTAGPRLGEAIALRWSDVDLRRGTISISRSFQEVHGHIEIGATKNRTSRRLVSIGKLAIAALRRRERTAKKEKHRSELVFPTMKGTPMRRSNLRRDHFTVVCTKAKVGGLRIHDLRHSMATLSLIGKVPAKVVAERLGHSTTRLTLDTYSHVVGDLQSGAASAVDAILRAPRRRAAR